MKEASDTYILTLETSGKLCEVGLGRNGELMGRTSVNIRNVHSRILAPLVAQLLENCGVTYKELSALGLSAGPGSFTGLRIGYSFAKGLAHALEIPVVEVPTLDLWAYQQGRQALPVIALVDAHRGEIFYCLYKWDDTVMNRRGEPQLIPVDRIADIVQGDTLVVGGDAAGLRDRIDALCGGRLKYAFPFLNNPQGWALLQLAHQKYLQKEFADPDNFEPLYMRDFQGVM